MTTGAKDTSVGYVIRSSKVYRYAVVELPLCGEDIFACVAIVTLSTGYYPLLGPRPSSSLMFSENLTRKPVRSERNVLNLCSTRPRAFRKGLLNKINRCFPRRQKNGKV